MGAQYLGAPRAQPARELELAVAGRRVERLVAVVIRRVHLGSRLLDEEAGRLQVPMQTLVVERRLAVAVARVHGGALAVQPPSHRSVPVRAREVKRRLALRVDGVDRRSLVEKALDDVQTAVDARVRKRPRGAHRRRHPRSLTLRRPR